MSNFDVQNGQSNSVFFDKHSGFNIYDQSRFVSFWEQSEFDVYVLNYFASFEG